MANFEYDIDSGRRYSDEEIDHIYELARFSAENGDIRRSETIAVGLVEVAPEYVPGWLILSYLHIQSKDYESALQAARQALRLDPDSVEAELLSITCLLNTGDFTSAGSQLGEVGDRINSGASVGSEVVRFYKTQLARYQNR